MNVEALKYRKLGYISIGLSVRWDSGHQQKRLELPQHWPSATLDTSPQYFNKHNNGIALLTGDKNDLYVIDCDVLKEKDRELGILDGTDAFKALVDRYGLPDNCPCAQSASGGMHFFFSLSKSLEQGLVHSKNTSKIVVTKGLLDSKHDCRSITIDTRGDGGCIIAAPTSYSLEEDQTRAYRWITPLVPPTELPAMPDWCIRLINESIASIKDARQHAHSMVRESAERVSATLTIDHTLFIRQTQTLIEGLQQSKMARIWQRTRGYDYALADRNKPCIGCTLTHTSNNFMVRGIADGCFWMRNYSSKCKGNVYNWEGHPLLNMILESPCTDAPYSRMLRDRYHIQGYNLVYTTKDRFLNFNGTVWEEMHKYVLTREIDSICGMIMDYLVKNISVAEDGDEDSSKEVKNKVARFRQGRNYLRKQSSLNSIAAYYKQMYTDVNIESKLDQNPNLLAVKNGIIDLRTGELREGQDTDFMMTQLDTIYEPNGKTDIIDGFVNSIFSDDQPTIRYVQKLLGYGITGHTREQCWAIFTGTGSNGKSLLISLIEALLGRWYITAAYDVFFKNEQRVKAGGPSPHLADLKGVRICVKEETEPKDNLNVEMLKIITGESTVTARQLYKDYESFQPTALPILLCNHKPAVDIDDDAMLRRIKVVPFNNIYTSPDDANRPYDEHNPRHRPKNPDLRAKLLTSHAQEQLLTWLVNGAVRWYTEKLGAQPQSMVDAFKAYCDENDKIKLFIDTRCELPPAGLQKDDLKAYHVNAGDFLAALNQHSSLKYKQKDLIEKMKTRGFKYANPRGMTTRVYTGLRML